MKLEDILEFAVRSPKIGIPTRARGRPSVSGWGTRGKVNVTLFNILCAARPKEEPNREKR